eukprot:CAMPEP_0197660174 /NCGR_PEP_ID=MMETSP1338-20131121/50688_1 /TAXON_ID=43686 ORGANISM="Pelagodinium beii, Strain RCC1491" /NCGR_SAMPLE_ID=MMETSP1338 /ASSEMBLY_ACC=CAM_ASM_000754 /LENGTH=289 /DNA_ID=CAMNT_0043237469 /DNA_START=13 /DNA_END=882 /DNA_ORIENTATION=+
MTSSSPLSLLATLCPAAWAPEEQRAYGDRGTEDYCVCLLQSRAEPGRPPEASFPGGHVDLSDKAMARANLTKGEDDIRLALRITALRNTFESAGMLVAGNPPPSFAREELQKILLREGPMAFHAFLNDWGIRLRPDSLAKLAYFVEAPDVHIYLARVPDANEVGWAASGRPAQDLIWVTPSGALLLHDEGRLRLPSAQRFVLSELCEQLRVLEELPDLLLKRKQRSHGGPLWGPPLQVPAASAALIFAGLPIRKAQYSTAALSRRREQQLSRGLLEARPSTDPVSHSKL